MATNKYFDAEVYLMNEDCSLTPKYNSTVQVRPDYDPQGMSVKIFYGEPSKQWT